MRTALPVILVYLFSIALVLGCEYLELMKPVAELIRY